RTDAVVRGQGNRIGSSAPGACGPAEYSHRRVEADAGGKRANFRESWRREARSGDREGILRASAKRDRARTRDHGGLADNQSKVLRCIRAYAIVRSKHNIVGTARVCGGNSTERPGRSGERDS